MAVRGTPQEIAERQIRRTKASTQEMAEGIQRVTIAPGASAAASKEKWLSKLQENADKWAHNTAAVPLAEWQRAAIEKGVPRVAAGLDAAKDKITNFYERVIPHIEAGQRKLDSMPKNNIEDSIARSTTMIRHMAEFSNETA